MLSHVLAGIAGLTLGGIAGFGLFAVLTTCRGPSCHRCGGKIEGGGGCFHN